MSLKEALANLVRWFKETTLTPDERDMTDEERTIRYSIENAKRAADSLGNLLVICPKPEMFNNELQELAVRFTEFHRTAAIHAGGDAVHPE